MTWLTFLIVSGIAVIFAGGLIFSRNAVHGAMCLVASFCAIATLFLLLSAEFIFVVQIAVYAGAIMVLFLFVMMLLNVQGQEGALAGRAPGQLLVALALGAALLGQAVCLVARGGEIISRPARIPAGFGSPEDIGTALFTRNLLPFEITSLVLLAAMAGAVVLARKAGLSPKPNGAPAGGKPE